MDLAVTLFDKDGFKFVCLKKNHYSLTFTMENNKIVLSKIIDFNLIKLIYDLNPDVYEKVQIVNNNNNDEIILTLLMKHFFEDLGLPQRYSFIHMKKVVEEDKIKFTGQSIKTHKPEGMPEDAELMSLQNMIAICDIITPHKIYFSFNVIFDGEMNFPPFAEKMVGMILHKIFKRVKQFIENVHL
jgi:hypothetical protein